MWLHIQDSITVVYTVLGPIVRHYALGYGFHTKQSHVPLLEVLQQIQERMEAIWL